MEHQEALAKALKWTEITQKMIAVREEVKDCLLVNKYSILLSASWKKPAKDIKNNWWMARGVE